MSKYPVTFDCNSEVFVAHNASELNIFYVYECGQNHHEPVSATSTLTASSSEPTITWPTMQEQSLPMTLPCGNDSIVVKGVYSDLWNAYECGLRQAETTEAQDSSEETSSAPTTSITLAKYFVALLALSVLV